MLEINLTDDSFNQNLTQHCQLSMQYSGNGFSYTILDLESSLYLVLKHYSFNGLNKSEEITDYFASIIQKDEYLQLSFQSKAILFVDRFSVLIPEELFDKSELKNYLNFTFTNTDGRLYHSNSLASIGCKNIFSYPESFCKILNTKFNQLDIFHFSTSFIQYLVKSSENNLQTSCFIYLNNNLLSIGLAQKSKLLFYNNYEYKSKNDIVYFILSSLEQYNLSAKTTEIFISSDTNQHEEIFDFLNDYLGNIKFIQACTNYKYSRIFDELYLTQFVNLFNLAHCES
jgi:hypothetical protein